jgi:hypothetical protein
VPLTFSEKKVEEIWRDYLPGHTGLFTEENEPLEVIYPGSRNLDPGADFRDAIIATGKGMLRGDVEIHVNSSSWREHGHHVDPNYNRVILHVVYRHNMKSGAVLQNGCTVPTLALEKYIDAPARGKIAAVMAGNISPLPRCRQDHHSDNVSIGQVLDAAGLDRFTLKADYFRGEIAGEGAGQALYRGIMTALGYSRNKEPMSTLAWLVPLQSLETLFKDGITDKQCLAYIQAKLLGAAGLLPSQQAAGITGNTTGYWTYLLEKTWAACGEKAQMSAMDWRFFKVRPGNYPTRRLAAMSHLLLRYRKTGLLAGLSRIIRETTPGNAVKQLEEAVFIGSEACRSEYPDTQIRAEINIPALLGKERAVDIIINVLLPFAAASGQINQSFEEEEKAAEIYRRYPAVTENMVVKDMRRKLGTNRNTVRTACRQQGLLHIFKSFCLPEKCCECPVGRMTDIPVRAEEAVKI